MNSQFNGFTANSTGTAWKSMHEITPAVQQHLRKVYGLLTVTSMSAFAGSWATVNYNLPLDGILGSLIAIACLFAVMITSNTGSRTEFWRCVLLGTFGFLQGASISPFLAYMTVRNPTVIHQALFGSIMIFGSFTASALLARRRSWLFLGGILSSALSILFWSSIFGRLLGSTTVLSVELYLGLLLFAGFVVFDTQLIVEKASSGDRDFVAHGATLFVDLFAIFVRILVILSRKNEQQNQRKDKKQR